MLVEINLLPQKEPRKKGFILILSGIAALILILGGFYFLQIQSTKTDMANLDRQIEMTKKLAEVEQKNTLNNEAAMSVTFLKNAVEWANSYPIQTIPVIRHLTGLLPERGFIKSFGYTEAGDVNLTVQFDSAREAAYFLDHLNESDWIADASLNSLNAQEMKETTEAAATTSTPTNNQNTNINSSGQTNSSNTSPSNSVIITADPDNPGGFIITPVDEKTTLEITGNKTVETKIYLPRYIGQFNIQLNKDIIKKLVSKGEDEEGGTAS